MVWESTRVLYNGPNVYAVEGLYEQQLDPGSRLNTLAETLLYRRE